MEGDTLQSLKEKALAEYRGKKVGYLFQNFELLDNLTGRENILLPDFLAWGIRSRKQPAAEAVG